MIVSVTGICVVWASFLQASGPGAPDLLLQEDTALMERLRREVESLPEERREAEGPGILLNSVSWFKSKPMKHRVYRSIAQLYQRKKANEKARVRFEEAGMPDRQMVDAGSIDAVSGEGLLDLLEEQGDLSGAVKQAYQNRGNHAVSDLEFAELTYKAGLALIRSGNAGAGVELGIAAAIERPCRDTFERLHTLGSDAAIHTPGATSDAKMQAMHWLRRNSGSYGESARFLSSLSHCEEVSGDIAAAMVPLKDLIELFPDSPESARAMVRLASLHVDIGDDETAKTYLTQVVEGNGPAKYKKMAQNTLNLIAAEGAPLVLSPPPPAGGGRLLMFVILHIVGFISIAAFWWWKRTRPLRA